MNTDNYEDIINLPHYEPRNHARMSIQSRAAQFSPFAALTGYDDAVRETARITDKKIEIDDGLKNILNNRLQILIDNIKSKPKASFTYFVKDKNKDGGKYITIIGSIKKVDKVKELVILENKTSISINDIINITSDLFKLYE